MKAVSVVLSWDNRDRFFMNIEETYRLSSWMYGK